jgi:hypothetical protein
MRTVLLSTEAVTECPRLRPSKMSFNICLGLNGLSGVRGDGGGRGEAGPLQFWLEKAEAEGVAWPNVGTFEDESRRSGEEWQEHLRRRVAGSGRHDPDALDLPEVAVECGDEARDALVRHRDDGGIGETQAALALAAEGFHDVGEHVRGRHELDVAGLKQDRSNPHGDIEPPTGEKHGDHLEEDVLGEKGRAPFAGDQLRHGGRRRAVMDIPLVVVGHEKAGVEHDHEPATSDPIDDGVDLLAEPFIAFRVRFWREVAKTASFCQRGGPGEVAADCLGHQFADRLPAESRPRLQLSVCAFIQVANRGIHVFIVTQRCVPVLAPSFKAAGSRESMSPVSSANADASAPRRLPKRGKTCER